MKPIIKFYSVLFCAIFLCLIISSVFYGCSAEKAQTSVNASDEGTYLINIEEILENKVSVKVSDIADTIEYIELKADAETVIYVDNIYVSEQYLFVLSHGTIYQFTVDGTFIRQIGQRGGGPGEYREAFGFFIDNENDRVGIKDTPVGIIHYYSTKDGSYLYTYLLSYEKITELFYKDSLFYLTSYPDGINKNYLKILNHDHDTLGILLNNDFYENMAEPSLRFPSIFYTYHNRLFFKGYVHNDTIWELNGTEAHRVHAIVNKGKYKSPKLSADESFKRLMDNAGDYYIIYRILEDDHYMFILLIPFWNVELLVPNIMYNKKEKKGFVTSDGFEDDITGGPVFWPSVITDGYYIDYCEAHNLLDEENSFNNASPSFEKFLRTLNEDSNTILKIAKRKRK